MASLTSTAWLNLMLLLPAFQLLHAKEASLSAGHTQQAPVALGHPAISRKLLQPSQPLNLDEDEEGMKWREHQDELQRQLHKKAGYLRGVGAYTTSSTAVHHPARSQALLENLIKQHEQLDQDARPLAQQQQAARRAWQQHVLLSGKRNHVPSLVDDASSGPANKIRADKRPYTALPRSLAAHTPSCVNIRLGEPFRDAPAHTDAQPPTKLGQISTWIPTEVLTHSSQMLPNAYTREQVLSEAASEAVPARERVTQPGPRRVSRIWHLFPRQTGDGEL